MVTKFTSRIAIVAVAGTVLLGALANVGVAQAAGSQADKGAAATTSAETLSLNYGKIQWVYTQQHRSDGGGATVGR